jgi:hypothetical protein
LKLDDILKFIADSSSIGVALDKELQRIPNIHGQLLNIRSSESLLLRKLEMELAVLRKERWKFYSGKAEPKQYKEEEFDLKVLRGDMDIFMDADAKVQDLLSKIAVQKEKVFALDEALKQINQRGYHLKTMVDFQRLMAGN